MSFELQIDHNRQIVDNLDFGLFLCFFNGMFPPGRLLKAARIGLGLNPDEVAEKAGISRASLSRLEAGSLAVSVKVADSVRKVLETYGVMFLTGDGVVGPSIRFPVDYEV
ncbi:helix-turn-helix domain-containing protein [Bosea beijingensis]